MSDDDDECTVHGQSQVKYFGPRFGFDFKDSDWELIRNSEDLRRWNELEMALLFLFKQPLKIF